MSDETQDAIDEIYYNIAANYLEELGDSDYQVTVLPASHFYPDESVTDHPGEYTPGFRFYNKYTKKSIELSFSTMSIYLTIGIDAMNEIRIALDPDQLELDFDVDVNG